MKLSFTYIDRLLVTIIIASATLTVILTASAVAGI
ncbi:MAG: hypothetical protein ACJASX_004063 [Limisphaerales bacterium]|jgi:hypothetical protein